MLTQRGISQVMESLNMTKVLKVTNMNDAILKKKKHRYQLEASEQRSKFEQKK